MKNVFKRIINGIFTAGLLSASAVGTVVVLAIIFGDGTELWRRIIMAVALASAFLSGFLPDGGENDSEAKNE